MDTPSTTRGPSGGSPAPTAAMARPDAYREFYEYEAEVYRISGEHEEAWRYRRLLVERLLPRDAGTSLLDVGCGDGAMTVDVARTLGGSGTGMDLSVRRATRATGASEQVRFVSGSSYDLPFATGSFPLVLCSDLLEHLDEPGRAFAELVRVTSRYVLVTVPYRIAIEKTLCPHCQRDYYLYGHQHSFGKEGLEALARDAGAEIVAFEHVIPMFECRRYKWFPPLKWLIWDHFKNTGTLGALIRKG